MKSSLLGEELPLFCMQPLYLSISMFDLPFDISDHNCGWQLQLWPLDYFQSKKHATIPLVLFGLILYALSGQWQTGVFASLDWMMNNNFDFNVDFITLSPVACAGGGDRTYLNQYQENSDAETEAKKDNWNIQLPSIFFGAIISCVKCPVYDEWQLIRPALRNNAIKKWSII